MSWPGGPGRAEDEPPTVVFPPVRDEPPGVPGLHYLPGSPTLLPGPGTDDTGPGDGPRRPWPWLAGLAAVAVLAALGVAWTFGRATDPPPRAAPPAPTASVTEPVAATTAPEVTEEPPPTTPAPVTTPPATTTTPPAPPAPSLETPRPALVRVPGVVGERRSGAQAELRRAGFAVSVREVPVGSRRQDRRVLAQLPPAGTPVPAGATVVLLVGEHVDDDR